ncbi:hypothetical protein B296_00049765, partial [Ensete ventricosum]
TIIRAGTRAPLVGRNPHERRLPSSVIRKKVSGHFRHKKISWSPPPRRRPYGCGSDPLLPRRSLPIDGPDPSVSPMDGVDLPPRATRGPLP